MNEEQRSAGQQPQHQVYVGGNIPEEDGFDRTQEHWFYIKPHYHKDAQLHDYLEAEGIDHFYPLQRVNRTIKGKRIQVDVPLMPGLFFIHTDYETLLHYKNLSSEVVGGYVPFTICMDSRWSKRRPTIIPDDEMENFRTACMTKEMIMLDEEKLSRLKVGDYVVVKEGVLKGVKGWYCRPDKNKGIVINLEGVGAFATTFYVPIWSVEPCEPPVKPLKNPE